MRSGSSLFNPERSTPPKVIVSRIRISLKFACKLFLEYQSEGEMTKSKEIKIDPKQKYYEMDEQVKWGGKDGNQDSTLAVYVRLISSKGVTFTAGILHLSAKQLNSATRTFKINLAKALDPESYCQCRYKVSSSSFKQILEPEMSLHNCSLVSFKGKSESTVNEELRNKVKDLQLQLQSIRTSYQLLKLQGIQSNELYINEERTQINKSRLQQQQVKSREKQYSRQIQKLEAELLKSNLTIERQKEIISMLQSSQRALNEEKAQLKILIRSAENELEQKRSKIRQLQGQKLNLMMATVTTEKEIGFLKQRIQECISKTYSMISKTLKEENQVQNTSGYPRFASFSASGWPKEEDYSLKLASQTHKFQSREDLHWDDQSEAFKDQQGSEVSSSAMNDISISNIKAKFKEEVSLLNSQLFIKGTQSNFKANIAQILRGISDFVKAYCMKVQKLWSSYRRSTRKQVCQLIQRYKGLQEYNHQFQRNQYSLLNHLQELQGGLQSQLGIVAERDKALAVAHQSIYKLEERIAEDNQMIRSLEAAVAQLEQERDQLKQQLHQNNYAYAQREEQLLIALKQAELSPVQDLSLSPRLKRCRNERKTAIINEFQNNLQRQIIVYKQQLKTLELQLSYERRNCRELKIALQAAEMQIRKHEFALKLKQRMQILNESIEVSRQESFSGEEGTKESKGYEQQQFAKVLAE